MMKSDLEACCLRVSFGLHAPNFCDFGDWEKHLITTST